jgi:hypothetical protein
MNGKHEYKYTVLMTLLVHSDNNMKCAKSQTLIVCKVQNNDLWTAMSNGLTVQRKTDLFQYN